MEGLRRAEPSETPYMGSVQQHPLVADYTRPLQTRLYIGLEADNTDCKISDMDFNFSCSVTGQGIRQSLVKAVKYAGFPA